MSVTGAPGTSVGVRQHGRPRSSTCSGVGEKWDSRETERCRLRTTATPEFAEGRMLPLCHWGSTSDGKPSSDQAAEHLLEGDTEDAASRARDVRCLGSMIAGRGEPAPRPATAAGGACTTLR